MVSQYQGSRWGGSTSYQGQGPAPVAHYQWQIMANNAPNQGQVVADPTPYLGPVEVGSEPSRWWEKIFGFPNITETTDQLWLRDINDLNNKVRILTCQIKDATTAENLKKSEYDSTLEKVQRIQSEVLEKNLKASQKVNEIANNSLELKATVIENLPIAPHLEREQTFSIIDQDSSALVMNQAQELENNISHLTAQNLNASDVYLVHELLKRVTGIWQKLFLKEYQLLALKDHQAVHARQFFGREPTCKEIADRVKAAIDARKHRFSDIQTSLKGTRDSFNAFCVAPPIRDPDSEEIVEQRGLLGSFFFGSLPSTGFEADTENRFHKLISEYQNLATEVDESYKTFLQNYDMLYDSKAKLEEAKNIRESLEVKKRQIEHIIAEKNKLAIKQSSANYQS